MEKETTTSIKESQPAVLDVPDKTWWKSPGLRSLYFMMPILFLGSTVNGYDGSLLNGLQTSKQWQTYFNNPTGHELGLFTAIQNIGAICALPFSSYAADIFGRKIGVATGIVIIFIGTILQVVPGVDRGMFIGGRFLVGFGSNLSQGSAPLLIMEVSLTVRSWLTMALLTDSQLAHPQHRGKLTTMYSATYFVVQCPSADVSYQVQHPVVRRIDHRGLDCVRHLEI